VSAQTSEPTLAATDFRALSAAFAQIGRAMAKAAAETGWAIARLSASFQGRTTREFVVTTQSGECRRVRQVLGGWSGGPIDDLLHANPEEAP
jgi:hypothetical protein